MEDGCWQWPVRSCRGASRGMERWNRPMLPGRPGGRRESGQGGRVNPLILPRRTARFPRARVLRAPRTSVWSRSPRPVHARRSAFLHGARSPGLSKPWRFCLGPEKQDARRVGGRQADSTGEAPRPSDIRIPGRVTSRGVVLKHAGGYPAYRQAAGFSRACERNGRPCSWRLSSTRRGRRVAGRRGPWRRHGGPSSSPSSSPGHPSRGC